MMWKCCRITSSRIYYFTTGDLYLGRNSCTRGPAAADVLQRVELSPGNSTSRRRRRLRLGRVQPPTVSISWGGAVGTGSVHTLYYTSRLLNLRCSIHIPVSSVVVKSSYRWVGAAVLHHGSSLTRPLLEWARWGQRSPHGVDLYILMRDYHVHTSRLAL